MVWDTYNEVVSMEFAKHYPCKTPQKVWGSGRIRYYDVDNNGDDDDDGDDDDGGDDDGDDDDGDDDDDEGHNAEDEVEDERWRMMIERRRKMKMLRKMMLRRKTDPKTGTRTSCEPAQSKRMSRFHKSNFIRIFTVQEKWKMPRPKAAAHTLCEPVQSKRASRFHRSHFIQKNAVQNHGPHFVRACAVETHVKIQKSHFMRKFTMSRFHKSFTQKFTGKILENRLSTLIKHRPLLLP